MQDDTTEKKKINSSQYLLSVGIDFGTTHCAVAYSYEDNPNEVHVFRNWTNGTPTSGKVPTAILFDSGRKCIDFGYGALKQYEESFDKDEHEDIYLFQNFKMQLYHETEINENMKLRDVSGKEMTALDVFEASIRFMKNELLSDMKRRRSDMHITELSVHWVITVPAIWCNSAKQFMRKAAEKAGCRSRSLSIALEPEAASICCRQLKNMKDKFCGQNNAKYLVVDIGGGTMDITSHQVIGENHLREIHRATGGDLGGNKVDEHFVSLLESLFSKDIVFQIRTEYPEEWVRVLQDFQTVKQELRPHVNKEVSIGLSKECPWDKKHFHQLPNELKTGIRLTKKNRLFIESSVIITMIKKVSSEISCHIGQLLKNSEVQSLDFIIIVGGFSNSYIVVNEIKDLVKPKGISVIVPENAELCVVSGAAMFGWKKDIIRTRKSRKTYGISISDCFYDEYDDENHAFYDSQGKKWCIDCFYKFVTVNEDVDVGGKICYEGVHPDDHAEYTAVELYSTDATNPKYTYEEGVSFIGKLEIPRPENARGKDITVNVFFGNTEIQVIVEDDTSGKVFRGRFDFLSQNFVKLID